MENLRILESGDVQLAIVQVGSVKVHDVVALAPLYREVAHIVIRRGRGIDKVVDLAGRSVILGPEGSGMRHHALLALKHYRIDVEASDVRHAYFMEMLEDESIDAAIVTTGLANPDLNALLDNGAFDLLPILDAEAVSMRNRHFETLTIPRGLYCEGPPVPSESLTTLATIAALVTPEDASGLLARETLAAVYETGSLGGLPKLISRSDAADWEGMARHPIARKYFNPYEGIDLIAGFMESIAAGKELLFAIGAGIYLLWHRARRVQARREAEWVTAQKKILGRFLDETVDIERRQMDEVDIARLNEALDEVTQIKLRALEELTHHDLRGDRTFLIFLTQCANLISKIQSKIDTYSHDPARPQRS